MSLPPGPHFSEELPQFQFWWLLWRTKCYQGRPGASCVQNFPIVNNKLHLVHKSSPQRKPHCFYGVSQGRDLGQMGWKYFIREKIRLVRLLYTLGLFPQGLLKPLPFLSIWPLLPYSPGWDLHGKGETLHKPRKHQGTEAIIPEKQNTCPKEADFMGVRQIWLGGCGNFCFLLSPQHAFPPPFSWFNIHQGNELTPFVLQGLVSINYWCHQNRKYIRAHLLNIYLWTPISAKGVRQLIGMTVHLNPGGLVPNHEYNYKSTSKEEFPQSSLGFQFWDLHCSF